MKALEDFFLQGSFFYKGLAITRNAWYSNYRKKEAVKTRLFIEASRSGYKPEQCGKTLTVAELIQELQGYDENAKVYLSNDGGYTFGSLNKWSLTEDWDDEVEE